MELSRLILEIDSTGVVSGTLNLKEFTKEQEKASKSSTTLGKSTDDLSKKFGAYQLIVSKLPNGLRSIASGMMGIVDPTTAAIGAVLELTSAMAQFANEGIEKYQEQEVQIARLGSVLQATGANAWTTTGQMQAFANVLQSTTGRASGEIMEMQAVLLGFTSITGETFERLTKGMIDMSSVMGGSLVGSANAFGKALDVPLEGIGALSRYGFKFTDQQKNLIKTLEESGRHIEAQAVVLDAMENAFGNSAEATREARGAIDDYNIAVNNLKKAIGERLEPTKNAFLGFFGSIIGAFADGIQGTNDYRKALDLLWDEAHGKVEIDDSMEGQIKRTNAELVILQYNFEIASANYRMLLQDAGGDELAISASDVALEYKKFADKIEETKDRLKELEEEQNKVAQSIANSHIGEIYKLFDNLSETYKSTDQGKESELLRIIDLYKRMKNEIPDLGPDTQRMIDTVIDMYTKQLEKGRGKIKNELTQWQEIFKSDMGLSDTDVKQGWFTAQDTALAEYTSRLEQAQERATMLAEVFGTDVTDALENTASAYEKLASDMIMSGAWQSDSNLFLQLVEYARQLRGEIDKINNGKLRTNTLVSATGIPENILSGLGSKDTLDAIITNMQTKSLNASAFSNEGLANYSEEVSKIADEWEEIYKYITSAQKWENGDLVPIFNQEDDEVWSFINKIKGQVDKSKGFAEEERGKEYNSSLQQEVDLAKQLAMGDISRDEYAARILKKQQNITIDAAREAVEREKIRDGYLALVQVMDQLGQSMLSTSLSSMIDMSRELGKAFQDGTVSASEMSNAIGNMLKRIIDAMPQMLLQAGLQMLLTPGMWGVGLALIGASGLAGFVSGLTDSPDKDKKKDDYLNKLKNIQDQITSLIDAQRQQEEYYLQKRRSLNASAVMNGTTSVNDLIVTPSGRFSTAPDDYIFAMKHPENLANSKSGDVYINIINNTDTKVQTETRETADGGREIAVMIENVVKGGIASGKFDPAFSAMNARQSGKHIRTYS